MVAEGAEQRHAERVSRVGGDDAGPVETIVDAAVSAMVENGFHGTSVRQIAERAGMSVANVYYYFASKQDLLFRLMDDSATQLLDRLEEMLADAPADPRVRLDRAVRLFVERHTARQARAFVAATELRALEPGARAVIVAKRDAVEAVFRRIVHDGVARGVFVVDDVELAVRAVLDMASSVSGWYKRGGALSGGAVAACYAGFALTVVGAGPGAEGGGADGPTTR